MIISRSLNPCLVLIVASSMALTQTVVKPSVESRRSKADQLREHHLNVLREHVLARLVDTIKKMDEPGLRLSARNQLLTYLTTDETPSEAKQGLATQIARDAITDLRQHSQELNAFMLSYLSNDLRSWLQRHRPHLIEDFEKRTMDGGDTAQHIRSLFELENGDTLAANRIRQNLDEQRSLNGLNFWLDELMRRNSKEFEPLASEILKRAEQGQVSFETLFWVSDIYLRPQTPAVLKKRFLTTVVMRTHTANFTVEPAPPMAYDLLTKVLPFVQQFVPELYDQALNQNVAIRVSLNESHLATEARIKRLKESASPIEDLKSEAESAKSKAERNELLLQAAQLAVEKKRFDLCLDILSDIDLAVPSVEPHHWQRGIDQILKKFVRASLAAKLTDQAEKGAARLGSSLTRVEALNLIMRFYLRISDRAAAQQILIEATKVAGSGSDPADEAKAFFLLSVACEQVDATKKADLLLSGVKALNSFSPPETTAREKPIYQTYVQRLDNSGYELIKGFQRLAKQDENSALALVEKLDKPDLRTFALIGILNGLHELLAKQN